MGKERCKSESRPYSGLMLVCGVSECTRAHVHERVQLLLWTLRELDHRKDLQRVLVQSVLQPEPVLVSEPQGAQLKTALDQEPEQIQDQDCVRSRLWEENVLQLKERLSCLRCRDAGLVSDLQDLDRQILELRLGAPHTQASPPGPESPSPDSRSSSGFFDLSDEASLSASLFSLCSALDPETTSTSPVTPPTTSEAPPTGLTFLTPQQRSISAGSSSSFGPAPFSPPSSPLSPPLSHLDRFISSLLQRRSLTPTRSKHHRPGLIQTSLIHRATTCSTVPPTGSTAPPTVSLGTPTLTAAAPLTTQENILAETPTDIELSSSKHHKTAPNSTELSLNVVRNVSKTFVGCSQEELEVKGIKGAGKERRVVAIVRSETERRSRRRKVQGRGRRFNRDCGKTEEEVQMKEEGGRRKHLSSTKTISQTESRERSSESLERVPSRANLRQGEREEEESVGFKKDRCSVQRSSRAAEEEKDRRPLHSHCVKRRTRLGQSQRYKATTSQERPVRKQHSEEGGTVEETGSEGERTGTGRARRQQQQLVRIKASRNLKRRILCQSTGTFTLMTTV